MIRLLILRTSFLPVILHSRITFDELVTKGDLVTSYETSHYCKPDPRYYTEFLDKLGLNPKDCLMIGNDVGEDIKAAQSLGISTFLITDCVIGDPGSVTTPSGSFQDAISFLEALPNVQ